MFGSLADKFTTIFSKFVGEKRLSEENLAEAVREVRLALLDADVHYAVTKNFIKRVKEKALGDRVIKSVTPGQQFIQVIHEELVALLGGGEASFSLSAKPTLIMMCGLQGAGKTTQSAKLARFILKSDPRKRIMLVACDLQRPAAIDQLKTLGAQLGLPVFAIEGEKHPLVVAKQALKRVREEGYDVAIFDTAGRLHIDDVLMKELGALKQLIAPHEIFFVANAATGQDAVSSAEAFNQQLEITGTILTMLDGDTRAGAALSIQEVTKKPLKFEGVGEKIEDLQLFHAHSMADRILGMGDTINLVKKAKEHFSEEEAQKLENKLRKATFSYEDYLKQIQAVRKMGSLKSLLKMMPGGLQIPNLDQSEKEFAKIEAIILSMTSAERQEKEELSLSRMKRIASGSGTEIHEVTKLRKSFKQSKLFFKNTSNKKMLEKMMRGR